MKRRSPASRKNPAPTGAVCACTVGTKTELPKVDTIIAHTTAIDHGFRERMPRHVNGFTAFMIGTSFRFRAPVDCGFRFRATVDCRAGRRTDRLAEFLARHQARDF